MPDNGPTLYFADRLHAAKYRGPNEVFREAMSRVANACQDSAEHYHAYRDVLCGQRFLPAGRVQAAMGSSRIIAAHNCLSGDTKILTREYGAVRIGALEGETVKLLDSNGDWVECPILCYGMQQTYALTFKGGHEVVEIRSTLEHGWVAKNKETVIKTKAFEFPQGRREIDDLRPRKDIAYKEDYKNGVLHGLIYGDGTRTTDGAYQIRVCSHHADIEPWLSVLTVTHPPSYNGDPLFRLSKIKSWCDLKALPATAKITSSYLLGFFRGWFAADGCVSTQPEATICAGPSEMQWLSIWGPVVGWHVRGFNELPAETNFGERKKQSLNIRLKKSSMCRDDFLIRRHKERWGFGARRGCSDWRIHGKASDVLTEKVYCPVVSTTHSFALACGIHSSNCMVSGVIEDSMDSIMLRAAEAAETMRMGAGIGYDFSTLRPRGSLIRSLESRSSGPVSFMEIYNSVCLCIASSGHRRGAQMAVMRCDHPDIEEFVQCKHSEDRLRGFNTSVAVTDAFMEAVQHDAEFTLRWKGKVWHTVRAVDLWEKIMRSTWEWSEPGVVFVDTINRMNNLHYCEKITTTNPCSEQPLPPFGACLLGSFNLAKYVSGTTFNYEQFRKDIPVVVRAMDNVIDRAHYPLPQQKREALRKRRMGLGVTGLANAGEQIAGFYGADAFLKFTESVLAYLRDGCYRASVELAAEKGPFPAFKKKPYMEGEFIKTLPAKLQVAISKFGLRNSHLTSIAPTGTISLCADNVSSGIEPVSDYREDRIIQDFDGPRVIQVEDYAYRVFGLKGKRAEECSTDEHLAVLLTAQRYVDSAVSKTCNVPSDMPWDDFKNVYMRAWKGGAKSCATFKVGGKRAGIRECATDGGGCAE